MKAKQFIYTSWKNGNSPSKGFMVYSMSEGISQEDSATIQTTLKYLAPGGLPFAPTPEQIESMFPRGCAYFKLPSGKYCLGQSTYIGRDYTGRQGNYIIHAFVFDEKPDLNAFEFIDSKLFKRNLTEEEANAESNPPHLPEVEVAQQRCAIDNKALVSFFTPEKLRILKYLIAAVLQADKTHKGVYLYDDYSAIPYWFRAIQTCLPQNFIKDITFTTYAINKSPAFLIQSLKPGSVVNYRMMLQLGEFVYNVKEKIINDKFIVGKFVNDVVDEFAKSVDAANAKVREIDAYMAQAGNDPDFALILAEFFKKNLSVFDSSEKVMDVVARLDSCGGVYDKNAVLNVLFAFENTQNYNILENDRFFRYLYESGTDIRDIINLKYLKVIEDYRERDINIFPACYKELTEKAPFPTYDLVSYITHKHSSLYNYLSTQKGNGFLNYFIVKLVAENFSNEHSDIIKFYFKEQLMVKNIKTIHEVNALIKSRSNAALLDTIVLNELNSANGILNGNNYDLLFAVLDEVEIPVCERALIILIKRCGKDKPFCLKAVAFMGKRHIDVNHLLIMSSNDAHLQNFIDDIFIYDFAHRSHSVEEIKKFYTDIYCKGKDENGTLVKAFENHFSGLNLPYEAQLEAAIEWCDYFRNNRLNGTDRDYIFNLIFRVLDSKRCNELLAAINGRNRNLVKQVGSFVESYREIYGEYPASYKVVDLGRKLQVALKGRGDNIVFDELCYMVSNNTFLSDVYCNKLIAKEYIEELFELYCKAINKRPYAVDDIIQNVFVPLSKVSSSFAAGNLFVEELSKKLAKINFKEAEDYVTPLVNQVRTPEVSNIIDAYFAKIGGGKSKKLIKKLLDNKKVNGGGVNYLDIRLKNKIWKNY